MPGSINYESLAKQLASLAAGDPRWLPLLANTAALIYECMDDVSWVGFYLLDESSDASAELVLGPFQGGLACTSIPWGRGVCGTAAHDDATQLVEDVLNYPGHIACDAASRSELVVPIHSSDGAVVGVLDIDSHTPARFSRSDAQGLEHAMAVLEKALLWS